jgi:hypothetical protein
MKRFVSLILSVCFLFSINTVSYAANISSRKASNPVIQSMNDKYHVDFSGISNFLYRGIENNTIALYAVPFIQRLIK